MKPQKSIVESLYSKYEYMARDYSLSLNNINKLAFEISDLEQEFKIKIFTSIKSYARKWAQYRRGECKKPVALKFYIQSALSNKRKDFMKYIERESVVSSMDEINYDYGCCEDTYVNVESNEFYLHGIDVLEGLQGIERSVYSLHLRGYNKIFLHKVISNITKGKEADVWIENLLEKQRNYLMEKYGAELMTSTQMYSSYHFDD